MRIGLLTELPLSERAGWSATLRRIREALLARGHRVDLLFEAPARSLGHQILNRLPGRSERHLLDAAQISQGARQADRGAAGVDLILSVIGSRLLREMRSSKPVALVTDATWKLLRAGYPEFKEAADENDAAELAAMHRAAVRIYSSAWARASAVHDYGVAPDRSLVVPFGANITPAPGGFSALPPPAGARCELLFIGRNWQRKGGDLAVAALAALLERGVNSRLTTIGQGPRRKPKLPPGAFRPLGWLEVKRPADAQAYEDALRGAHFLLLPTRADCTPIVCAEASSFAVPTVASEVGGLRAMIEPGINGSLLPPTASAADFAEAILALWRRPKSYADLRRSSRAHFERRLSWGAWAADVEEILEGVPA